MPVVAVFVAPIPSIVAAMGGVAQGGWVVISIFTAVICLIAIASALTARETKDVPTSELGLPPERRAHRRAGRLAPVA